MRTFLFLFVWSVSLVSLVSCSLFSSGTQEVVVTTNSPKSAIKVDGIPQGQGMATVRLPKNRDAVIIVEEGPRRGYAQVHSELSATGTLDIVGGVFLLFPFLGFLSRGAWKLDKETVYVEAV